MTGRPRLPSVVVVGLLLVGAATAFRTWAITGAWFFYDDFWYLHLARTHHLTPAYLVTSYNGHLMPAGMLLNWVNAAADPLGFTWPATEMVLGFALAGGGMVALLHRMFGPRRGVLVPLTLFLFSPILLPATTWWAAGVNQVPLLISLVFGLERFVAYLQRGGHRYVVQHVLWLLFGLAFTERTLVLFLLCWLAALLWFTRGTGPERLQALWRGHRRVLLTHALIVVGYLAAYIPLALNFNAAAVARRPFFAIVQHMVVTAFSAGFVGGPLDWKTSEVTQQAAHPSPSFLLLSQMVVLALVVASARTRRRGLRAWLLPVAVLALNVALVAVSRAIYFGPEIALDYRFQTEAALAAALALGGAFMPVLGALEPSEPRDGAVRLDTPGWAVPGLALFLVLATVTTSRFPLRDLGASSPRRYLQSVSAEARSHPDAVLLNGFVPKWLTFAPNTYSEMFEDLPHVRVSNAVTGAPYLVDRHGRFREARFHPVRDLDDPLPKERACPARLDRGSSTWPLDGPVYGTIWFVEVAYTADADATARLRTGGRWRTVRLTADEHRAYVAASGAFHEVRLRLASSAGRVCLTGLRIGSVSLS